MAQLIFSTKDVRGYALEVTEPIHPNALAHLAASGIFDEVALRYTQDGKDVVLSGANMVKEALRVSGK